MTFTAPRRWSTDKYILRDHTPVPVADVIEWALWTEANRDAKRVALWEQGDVKVSTVFLGIDHSFGFGVEPILFETMIFAGDLPDLDESQWRYATWDEAEAGHREAVARVMVELALTS